MSLNWNFQRGGGFKPKKSLSGGSRGVKIYSETNTKEFYMYSFNFRGNAVLSVKARFIYAVLLATFKEGNINIRST